MGKLFGNAMSPLSALKQLQAVGPALSHSLFRAGIAAPSMLLSPLIGNFLNSAKHGQISSGMVVISLSNGKSALHTFGLAFVVHDDRGLRSPVAMSSFGLQRG